MDPTPRPLLTEATFHLAADTLGRITSQALDVQNRRIDELNAVIASNDESRKKGREHAKHRLEFRIEQWHDAAEVVADDIRRKLPSKQRTANNVARLMCSKNDPNSNKKNACWEYTYFIGKTGTNHRLITRDTLRKHLRPYFKKVPTPPLLD